MVVIDIYVGYISQLFFAFRSPDWSSSFDEWGWCIYTCSMLKLVSTYTCFLFVTWPIKKHICSINVIQTTLEVSPTWRMKMIFLFSKRKYNFIFVTKIKNTPKKDFFYQWVQLSYFKKKLLVKQINMKFGLLHLIIKIDNQY